MKKVYNIFIRYKLFLLLLLVNLTVFPFLPDMSLKAFRLTGESLLDMLVFIPPIFVLLGLFDVWVEREAMMRFMGTGSGGRGVVLAFLLGSLAAGPLYIAFPIAAVLIRKGATFLNVFVFIGAWATTKVPMLLFEASSLGLNYTLARLFLNICGIIGISLIMDYILSHEDCLAIRTNADSMQDEVKKKN